MNFIQEAISRAREDKDFGTMYLAMAVGELQKQINTPQRTWVGLTEQEINEWTPEIHDVIRTIEAKLKEKNA